MATTWKQVVYDVADAYREADGSTAKIPVGQLADKVREGAGIPYTGDNPLTVGQNGYTFEPKTLLKDGLTIVNGVNGEDLTDVEARQALAVADLMKMVSRKVSEARNFGDYVWKKYDGYMEEIPAKTGTIGFSFVSQTGTDGNYSVVLQTTLTNITNAELAENISILSGVACANYYTDSKQPIKFSGSTGVLYGTNSVGTYAFDQSTGRITMHITSKAYGWDFKNNYTYNSGISITVPAIPSELGDFLDYVVSDDPTAYPDGGELDGYWYERYVERLTPEMFGCTKMDTSMMLYSGTFTLKDLNISHGLGEIPRVIIIRPTVKFTLTSSRFLDFAIGVRPIHAPQNTANMWMVYGVGYLNNGAEYYSGGASSYFRALTENMFRFANDSSLASYYWKPGIEYEVITMA